MRVFEAAAAAIRDGQPAALVTVTGRGGSAPRRPGARMLVYDTGDIVGTVGGGAFEHRCQQVALETLRTGLPQRLALNLTRDLGMCCGGAMEAFVEPLRRRPRLVIYGAGHVGQAVAQMALALDWHLVVVDERDELNTPGRLPSPIDRRVVDPRRVLSSLPTTAMHLVVTHDHALDQDIVEALLAQGVDWLGMIGSRAKATRFFLRFRAAGMDPALFPRLICPVGLDLGATEPGEIAVSVLAQLVQHVRGSVGDAPSLAARPLPIRDGPSTEPTS